jgi:hypothetical protein
MAGGPISPSHRSYGLRRQKWVKSRGSGVARRPSGLPSIADILLRCREPPLWALRAFEFSHGLGHNQTDAVQETVSSLDQLVGASERRRWHGVPERFH